MAKKLKSLQEARGLALHRHSASTSELSIAACCKAALEKRDTLSIDLLRLTRGEA